MIFYDCFFGAPIRLNLLLVALFCMCAMPMKASADAQVKGNWQKTPDGKKLEQKITLFNNKSEFHFLYDIAIPKGSPKGNCVSKQWVFGKQFITLGMRFPSFYNWYKQGFLTVIVDGENLYNRPIDFKVVRSTGTDAMVQGTWETPKGPIYIRFLMRDNDDKLMLQIAASPKTKIETLKVRLLAYPQGFTKPYDRRMYTNTRDVSSGKSLKLDAFSESWVLFYDEAMYQSKRARGGPCGFVYVPNEAVASVDLGPYEVITTLVAKSQKRSITLGLWDFSHDLDVESIKKSLLNRGSENTKELAMLAGLDWNAQPVPSMPISLQANKINIKPEKTPAYFEMTNEIVTPHINWAKPLVQGPVDCLVVAPMWGQRETVELAQRLDLKYQTISLGNKRTVLDGRGLYLYGSYDLYGYSRKTPSSIIRELRKSLTSQYDCFILSNFEPSIIPDDIQKTIVEKVRSGTGVILLGEAKGMVKKFGDGLKPNAWGPSSVPISTLPIFDEMIKKNKPIYSSYTFGKGRVVTLNYASGGSKWERHSLTPMLTHRHADVLPYYDYYQSLVAKSVLWVSQRTLPIEVCFSDKPHEIILKSDHEESNLVLHVLIDDVSRSIRRMYQCSINLKRGENLYSLKDIGLPTGARYLNVWVKRKDYVLGWGSTKVDLNLKSPHIQTIELEQSVVRDGQSVAGRVEISSLPQHSKLMLEIYDQKGRLLKKKKVYPSSKVIFFSFDLTKSRTVLHEIHASLWVNGEKLDYQIKTFARPQQKVDDFQLVVWMDAANDAIAHYILQQLVKYGVTCLDNVELNKHGANRVAKWVENAAKYGLSSIPYITRISPRKTKKKRVRNPCLTNPKYIESWLKTLQDRANVITTFGPLAYSLGDENHLMLPNEDLCISSTCLEGFHGWLEGEYKTIGQLNASWKTKYIKFKEIVPETFEQVRHISSHWPRWLDHRRFMDVVFTNVHRLGVKAIQEVDPQAKVGFDGLFGLKSRYGYDFYQLCQVCDMVQVYAFEPAEMEYLRSWHQPNAIRGAWLNEVGNTGKNSVEHTMWKSLFNGFNSSWYWMAYNTGPALLFPDLRPTPQLKWIAQVQKEIRGGIGKLILNAIRQQDGIAVYYSQPSVHAAKLLGKSDQVGNAHRGVIHLLEDVGVQYNFVASEQVVAGILEKYKVLVMTSCFSLSNQEVQAVKKFVEGGGVVIADTMPGIFNNHGKLINDGTLEKLFGVKRSGLPAQTVSPIFIDHAGIKARLPLIAFDRKIKAAGAKVWGNADETQCVFEFSSGKGKTILLNASLENYEGLREKGEEEMIVSLMDNFLTFAGISPPVRITSSGKKVQACEIVRFLSDEIEYVSILKDNAVKNNKAQVVCVDFGRKAFVYDVRKQQVIGNCTSVVINLLAGDPKIYALLPYEDVTGVDIKADRPNVFLGEEFAFNVLLNSDLKRDLAGVHCLRIELVDPQGKRLNYNAQNILTSQREKRINLCLALNDLIGTWHIEVRDVLTGVFASQAFEVSAPPR